MVEAFRGMCSIVLEDAFKLSRLVHTALSSMNAVKLHGYPVLEQRTLRLNDLVGCILLSSGTH